MKKQDLDVGTVYAHKDSLWPHMLASMQMWKEIRTGFGYRVEGHVPALPDDRPRRSRLGSGTVGRVCLVAGTEEELRHIDLPEFLEYEDDQAFNSNYSELFMRWKDNLPEGVRVELVNTAQLQGPFASIMKARREEMEHHNARIREAQQIQNEWGERLNRVQRAAEQCGVKVRPSSFEKVFPDERVYVNRTTHVELTIEEMEKLLSIKEGE